MIIVYGAGKELVEMLPYSMVAPPFIIITYLMNLETAQ
jgi:hypothetical protein